MLFISLDSTPSVDVQVVSILEVPVQLIVAGEGFEADGTVKVELGSPEVGKVDGLAGEHRAAKAEQQDIHC